jgi:hypothetical protein
VRAYKRTDLFERRRKLMEMWSAFCAKPPAALNLPRWRHDVHECTPKPLASTNKFLA